MANNKSAMELMPPKGDHEGDNESSVFLSSMDSNSWISKSEADKRNEEIQSTRISETKTPTFTKKPLLYSKSVMVNFISWLGLNEEEEDDKGEQWKELVRRRRVRNMIVGQYKDGGEDETDLFTPTPKSIPHIIDPLARPGYTRQLSKISIVSSSRRSTRFTNPTRLMGKESVWRMAYNGLKTAMTPQITRDNLHPLHPRSITLHQIRMEEQRKASQINNNSTDHLDNNHLNNNHLDNNHLDNNHLDNNNQLDNDYLDDAFFDAPTPTAVFPNLILPTKRQNNNNNSSSNNQNTSNNSRFIFSNINYNYRHNTNQHHSTSNTHNLPPLIEVSPGKDDDDDDDDNDAFHHDKKEDGLKDGKRRSLIERRRDKNNVDNSRVSDCNNEDKTVVINDITAFVEHDVNKEMITNNDDDGDDDGDGDDDVFKSNNDNMKDDDNSNNKEIDSVGISNEAINKQNAIQKKENSIQNYDEIQVIPLLMKTTDQPAEDSTYSNDDSTTTTNTTNTTHTTTTNTTNNNTNIKGQNSAHASFYEIHNSSYEPDQGGYKQEHNLYKPDQGNFKPNETSDKPDQAVFYHDPSIHRASALPPQSSHNRFFQPMRKLSTEAIEEIMSQKAFLPQKELTKRHLPTHKDTHTDTHMGTHTGIHPGGYPMTVRHTKTHRQLGKGFAQYFADLEYRKSRLDSTVRRKISSLPDHRPYFTFWCTFVQVVCYVIALFVHDLAPFGLSYTSITEEVLKPNLGIEESSYVEENNVWIGLRQADLIHMGARYSGCMRRDELVEREVEMVKRRESGSGCCIRLDGSGCYQASEKLCLYPLGSHLPKSSLTRWKTWSNHSGPFNRSSGAVCHQDPRFCMTPILPPNKQQHDWPDDITRWPTCNEPYRVQDLPADSDLEHLTCGMTGRPCCVGVRGGCVITTREDCTFMRGYYHDDKTLCSHVDCMEDICGMIPFLHHNIPDQIYRLISSLFIHAGVVHLLVTVVFQLTVMRDLEKLAGWLRIALIYLLSGIGGSLFAAILLPHLIEAGPSGSQFGLLSCLFVEVIQNWYILKKPKLALLRLCLLLFFLLSLGLMPMVDNIAHIGGFVMGFMLSFVFLPYINYTVKARKRKLTVVVVCGVLSSLFLVGLMVMFYLPPFFECGFCHYLNCIPITPTLCSNLAITGSDHS